MNIDIRLSIGFWQHPKTRKTVKRLGLEGVRSLQVLWLWAAQNRPDGNLAGMDWEDIELAADWQGEDRAFFDHCLGVWIDENTEGYCLHDWAEHNPWQAEADARREQARKNAKSGWEKRKKAQTHVFGIADSMPLQSDCNAGALRPHDFGNAPSPSPDPEENTNNSVDSSENLDRARARRTSQTVEGGEDIPVFPNSPLPSPPEPRIGTGDEPSLEFLELRAMYSEHVRAEGELTGFIEYKQAKAARGWPGLNVILDDIDKRLKAGVFRINYGPSLRKYLAERYWKVPIPASLPQGRARDAPEQSLTERNMATARQVLTAMEAEHGK